MPNTGNRADEQARDRFGKFRKEGDSKGLAVLPPDDDMQHAVGCDNTGNMSDTVIVHTEIGGEPQGENHEEENDQNQLADPAGQDPAEETAYLRSQLEETNPDRDNPEYDDLRTRLAKLEAMQAGQTSRTVGFREVFHDVSEPDGGGTWNPITGRSPIFGFCHSPYPERSQVVEFSGDADEAYDEIMVYATRNADLLKQEGKYLGMWTDPDAGKTYLDVSEVEMDAASVRDKCLNNDQIAFYDLQMGSSVTVNPDAKSGQEG